VQLLFVLAYKTSSRNKVIKMIELPTLPFFLLCPLLRLLAPSIFYIFTLCDLFIVTQPQDT